MPDNRKETNGSESVVLVLQQSILGLPVGSEFNAQRLNKVFFRLLPVDESVNGGLAFPIEAKALQSLLNAGIFKVKD